MSRNATRETVRTEREFHFNIFNKRQSNTYDDVLDQLRTYVFSNDRGFHFGQLELWRGDEMRRLQRDGERLVGEEVVLNEFPSLGCQNFRFKSPWDHNLMAPWLELAVRDLLVTVDIWVSNQNGKKGFWQPVRHQSE
jgi:hypothetical protein